MSSLNSGPVFTSLADQIKIHGQFRPNDIALVEGERSVSWRDYNAAANRIAHLLLAAGIEPGDRVSMLVGNTIWAHEVLLGIWRAGAVAVPLSPLLTPDTLSNMVKDAGAAAIFATPELSDAALASACGRPLFLRGQQFAEQAARHSDEAPRLLCSPADLAVIIYSSGTTGLPKGIVHDNESRLKFAAYFAAEFRFHYHSTALSCVPMHSNGAWLSWAPAKWIGATTLVLPSFNADTYLRAVAEHRPTHGFAVPTMATALLQHPHIEKIRLDCFETLITAGSPMPDAVKREIQRLSGDALYELWGLTEGVATIMGPQDMRKRPCSVGRPMLGCDIRVIDAHDRDVTFRDTGEIVGRSAAMMRGYWNRDDANTAVVWRDGHGAEFIRTGDIGAFDEDGFLTLKGRKKDMIISGGLNVYPVDIEARLLEHEAVQDVAVIGVTHDKWGETPVAFVRLKPDALLEAEALRQWANARLSRHQRLFDLRVRSEDFPRNTLGKILKNALKEEYSPAAHGQ